MELGQRVPTHVSWHGELRGTGMNHELWTSVPGLMLKTSVIRMIKTEFVSISKVGQLYLKAVKKLTSAFVRREMNSRDTLMTKSWNSSLDQSGM